MNAKKKCTFPGGWEVRIGIATVDPCLYQDMETVKHTTVRVLRCVKCGRTKVLWENKDGVQQLINDYTNGEKCSLPGGWSLQFGEKELDLCRFEVAEEYRDATVYRVRCYKCGNEELRWMAETEETEEEDRR